MCGSLRPGDVATSSRRRRCTGCSQRWRSRPTVAYSSFGSTESTPRIAAEASATQIAVSASRRSLGRRDDKRCAPFTGRSMAAALHRANHKETTMSDQQLCGYDTDPHVEGTVRRTIRALARVRAGRGAMLITKRAVLVAGVASVLLVGGGVAAAAIVGGPIDSSGVIHGCYSPPNKDGS